MAVLRVIYVPLLVLMLAVAGRAHSAEVSRGAVSGEDLVRGTVEAATRDAVEGLLEEVGRVGLSDRLSVARFLRDTESHEELRKTLRQAEQVGGPRWLDDRRCQVELQVSGTRVATALQRIAAANADRTPLPVDQVTVLTRGWERRSFAATGQAVAEKPVGQQVIGQRTEPALGDRRRDPWARVSDVDKEHAVAAARLDAARKCLRSVSPVSLTARSTVGDVLGVDDIGGRMEDWFMARPVKDQVLREDMQAVVTLTATPDDTFEQFKGLAVKQREISLPRNEGEWGEVKDQFRRRMAAPVGRGSPPEERAADVGRGDGWGPGFAPRRAFGLRPDRRGDDGIVIPGRPPEWVGRQVDADGTAGSDRGRLHAARNAEADAEKALRKLVEDLPLSRDLTVGQAAKNDRRVGRALDEALGRARIGQTKYHEDGTATVRLYLELEDVWYALERASR
jgi:hypothetical protein